MKAPRSILVFRPAGLGDFIMSTPAMSAVRKRWPDSRLILLTLQSGDAAQARKVAAYAGGHRAAPWVDLVRPHIFSDVLVVPASYTLSALLALRRELAQFDIDLVVQMFDVGTPWRSRLRKLALLVLLLGPRRQIGWRVPGSIVMNRVPSTNPGLGHHVHGPMHFLKELDGPAAYSDDDVYFDLRPGVAATERIDSIWQELDLSDKRVVAIAPGAIHSHKDWPLESFAALISHLLGAHPDIACLVIGSPSDRAKAVQLMQIDPTRIFDLTGRTTIAESAVAFARCALVVGNDGGAMHLADAMKAVVVSIVPGLEFPGSVEPWHNQDRAIRHPIDCAPCYSFTYCPQGHRRCMLDIPVKRVIEQCERVL